MFVIFNFISTVDASNAIYKTFSLKISSLLKEYFVQSTIGIG